MQCGRCCIANVCQPIKIDENLELSKNNRDNERKVQIVMFEFEKICWMSKIKYDNGLASGTLQETKKFLFN